MLVSVQKLKTDSVSVFYKSLLRSSVSPSSLSASYLLLFFNQIIVKFETCVCADLPATYLRVLPAGAPLAPPTTLPHPRRVLSPARRACPANTTRRLARPRRSISEDGVNEVAGRGRWMTSSRLPFVPPVHWLLCITWITEHTLPVGHAHTHTR